MQPEPVKERAMRCDRQRVRARLAALGLGALLAAGCSGEPARGSPGAAPAAPAAPAAGAPATAGGPSGATQPLVKTHSAYPTTSASSAPWWMALEGGYFREQGLDVDLQFIAGGVTLNAALAK